jgi:hypothetical protein
MLDELRADLELADAWVAQYVTPFLELADPWVAQYVTPFLEHRQLTRPEPELAATLRNIRDRAAKLENLEDERGRGLTREYRRYAELLEQGCTTVLSQPDPG